MQFQLATDYAVRILRYLYDNGNQLSTAVSMSEKLGVTYLYFMKVISKLKQAGLVESVQGCNGGYRLSKDADNITFFDVVDVMEGGICICRCLDRDEFCSQEMVSTCGTRKYYIGLQNQLIDSLKAQKIADLVDA